jgi:hypothetical protein
LDLLDDDPPVDSDIMVTKASSRATSVLSVHRHDSTGVYSYSQTSYGESSYPPPSSGKSGSTGISDGLNMISRGAR